ncbi:phosphatase PAP2 family protein [Dactylosporangium sp. NPDC051484]|uniref:phosphatase PAP2 family protein n=1 Tax=Dactylosporangium sp. NPDC051484 TaxID=3154942 RepID=UPI00344BCCC6
MPSPDRSHRAAALVPGLAALALAVLSVLVAARASVLLSADAAVSAAARRFTAGHGWWHSAMAAVTHSADPVALYCVLVAVLAACLLGRRWWPALFVASVAASGTGARLVLLHLIARPRPEHRLIGASGFSFPSGHTTSSALAAGVVIVLGLAVLRPRWARRALVAVALAWAVLVGVSRVALVAHWPTDVLGGWLLATTVITALAFALHRKVDPHASADSAHRGGSRGARRL